VAHRRLGVRSTQQPALDFGRIADRAQPSAHGGFVRPARGPQELDLDERQYCPTIIFQQEIPQ
jgi:hypothetical protein